MKNNFVGKELRGMPGAHAAMFTGGIGTNYNIIPRHFAKICELCAKSAPCSRVSPH